MLAGRNTAHAVAPPSRAAITAAARREAEGRASSDDLASLAGNEVLWARALWDLIDDAEDELENVRDVRGQSRAQILADYESALRELEAALLRVRRLRGEEISDDADAPAEQPPVVGRVLQLSWRPGEVVAWMGGPRSAPADEEEVRTELAARGGGGIPWAAHDRVPLPGGGKADALTTPIGQALGWLVQLGADSGGDDVGASVAWLGRVAVIAVDLVARGAMVPQLQQVKGRPSANGKGTYSVRWTPALTSPREIEILGNALPGALIAFDRQADRRTVAQEALTDVVDAICRMAIQRLELPAPPPHPATVQDVAESVLARVDGSEFEAPAKAANDIARRLERWARPVRGSSKMRLVLHLDPPDSGDAWHLKVFAPGSERDLEPVEVALVTAASTRRREVEDHLARLERLVPILKRPGGHRRGEVILSQDEAWEVMTESGVAAHAAGFDVRIPKLSRKKATPSLRLNAEEGRETSVGAQQLANVRWSALFDDVELTAEEIAQLARQARPMVQSRGKWVELDRADLTEAAAVLAERGKKPQLTGAEMLRHALGLEGEGLAGGISLGGSSWASDLLASASRIPETPDLEPEGFLGELRSYQGEALAWLNFLNGASLGGCLALDMGLGKTPTMLAHLRETKGNGPALAILPPAVLGNWASEAKRFTPGLRVVMHHGANRTSQAGIARLVGRADVVLTTYGTAVRDIDALSAIQWDRVILDEAQVIKNPTSDTAQQLRRLDARVRVALTGTPIENGLGDLWAIMDFVNPGLVGPRSAFIAALSVATDSHEVAESALKALNGILVFRRTKSEPEIAAELPDRIDELDHCTMTPEQIGLYQAVLDNLVLDRETGKEQKGQILAAITALKQICNHPAAYRDDEDGVELEGRSGKLARLDELTDRVFGAGERMLVFTHFAQWGEKLAKHMTKRTGVKVSCYHGGLSRGARDQMVADFQKGKGAGAMVLSLKAGGTGLNLTAASHVILYDRWWNPAVEDQARDRVWRIGQTKTVLCHRLVCPGTVDERVEEVVAGKRQIADMVLPKSSSINDLDNDQLRVALGLHMDELIVEDADDALEVVALEVVA